MSNVATGVYASLAEHPFRVLRDAGVTVTLNSDDPPMFGAWLTDVYRIGRGHVGLRRRVELAEIARTGVRASFADDDLKREILAGHRRLARGARRDLRTRRARRSPPLSSDRDRLEVDRLLRPLTGQIAAALRVLDRQAPGSVLRDVEPLDRPARRSCSRGSRRGCAVRARDDEELAPAGVRRPRWPSRACRAS